MRTAIALLILCSGCGGSVLVWHGRSADRRVQIAVREENGWQWMEKDGEPDELTAEIIAFEELRMSRDGAHVAYPVSDGKRWSVVRDGYLGAAFDSVGELVFSRDGNHLAYAAEKDHLWHVVRDGSLGGKWSALLSGTIQLSDDGARIAYAGKRSGEIFVHVDGKEYGPYLGVANLSMSGDGAHIAYAARSAEGAFVVSDGVRSPLYRKISGLAVGKNGARWFGQTDAGWIATIEGTTASQPWDSVSDLVVANGRWAHAAIAEGKSYVVLDGEARPTKKIVRGSLVLDPTGRHLGFVVEDSVQRRAVIDFVEGAHFHEIERIVFDADGDHAAYLGRRGDVTWLILDGRPQQQEKLATNLILSADGSGYAYVTGGEVGNVVVNGKRYAADVLFPETLAFDRTGRHWGCVAGDSAEEELFFMIDGDRRRLDLDEVTAALMQRHRHLDRESMLAEWMVAELAIRPTSSASP